MAKLFFHSVSNMSNLFYQFCVGNALKYILYFENNTRYSSQSLPGGQLLKQIPHGVFYRSIPALFHCCGSLPCSLVYTDPDVFPLKSHRLSFKGPIYHFTIAAVKLLKRKRHFYKCPCK